MYNKWLGSAMTNSSLKDYVSLFKSKPGLEDYLVCKLDFYGASMKFKARSNTLPLNGRTHSWKPDINMYCPLCDKDIEDLRHFLFTCSTLNSIRVDEFRKLEDQLLLHNLADFWRLFMSGNLSIKMCLMLGLTTDEFPLNRIFDVFCKSYLKRAWTARSINIV